MSSLQTPEHDQYYYSLYGNWNHHCDQEDSSSSSSCDDALPQPSTSSRRERYRRRGAFVGDAMYKSSLAMFGNEMYREEIEPYSARLQSYPIKPMEVTRYGSQTITTRSSRKRSLESNQSIEMPASTTSTISQAELRCVSRRISYGNCATSQVIPASTSSFDMEI